MACCFLIKNVKGGLGFKHHSFCSFLLPPALVVWVTSNGDICPLSFCFLSLNNLLLTVCISLMPSCFCPTPPTPSLVAKVAQNVPLEPPPPSHTPPSPISTPPSQVPPLFLFLWNKQYSLALFDPLTMQGLHVWPVFLDQQVVAGKLLKGSSFFSLSAPLCSSHTDGDLLNSAKGQC